MNCFLIFPAETEQLLQSLIKKCLSSKKRNKTVQSSYFLLKWHSQLETFILL